MRRKCGGGQADEKLTPVFYIFEAPKGSRTIWLNVTHVEDAPLDPMDKKLSKCRHIVMEIKSTEKNFVGQLAQLLELDRSKEAFLVLCQEQEPAFKEIFTKVLHVYTLNNGLLKDLMAMKVVHEEVCVPDAFSLVDMHSVLCSCAFVPKMGTSALRVGWEYF